MNKLVIKTATEENFFKRGRTLARLADRHQSLPHERVLSFEDPAEMLKLLTVTRLALFQSVKERPGSITAISERLNRDRSAVKRDVDELFKAGLVTVESKILPGHGRMKEVRVAAKQFKLEARLT